jgi:hypothetical protein
MYYFVPSCIVLLCPVALPSCIYSSQLPCLKCNNLTSLSKTSKIKVSTLIHTAMLSSHFAPEPNLSSVLCHLSLIAPLCLISSYLSAWKSGLVWSFSWGTWTETETGLHWFTDLKRPFWTDIDWFRVVLCGFLRLRDWSSTGPNRHSALIVHQTFITRIQYNNNTSTSSNCNVCKEARLHMLSKPPWGLCYRVAVIRVGVALFRSCRVVVLVVSGSRFKLSLSQVLSELWCGCWRVTWAHLVALLDMDWDNGLLVT